MMSKLRFMLFCVLMSMVSNMYAQGDCLQASLVEIFQKEQVKDVSFAMYYHTRTMNHKFGDIYLKGRVKHGSTRLCINELQDSYRKTKWIKYYFKPSIAMEDSLMKLIDSLFLSKSVPPILKKEELDMIRYDEQNCFQVKIKHKKEYEKYDFYFGDYLQTQIASDIRVTYSPQMIKLLRLIENIVEKELSIIKENILSPK